MASIRATASESGPPISLDGKMAKRRMTHEGQRSEEDSRMGMGVGARVLPHARRRAREEIARVLPRLLHSRDRRPRIG